MAGRTARTGREDDAADGGQIEALGAADLWQGRTQRGAPRTIPDLGASGRGGTPASRARRTATPSGRPVDPYDLPRRRRGLPSRQDRLARLQSMTATTRPG